MSFYFNGAQANVTVDTTGANQVIPTGSVPVDKTRISKVMYHTFAGAGRHTIYTPPAGKKLYVTNFVVCASAVVQCKLGDNLADEWTQDTLYEGTGGYAPANNMTTINLSIPLEISTLLNMRCGSAASVFIAFCGWLE